MRENSGRKECKTHSIVCGVLMYEIMINIFATVKRLFLLVQRNSSIMYNKYCCVISIFACQKSFYKLISI